MYYKNAETDVHCGGSRNGENPSSSFDFTAEYYTQNAAKVDSIGTYVVVEDCLEWSHARAHKYSEVAQLLREISRPNS